VKEKKMSPLYSYELATGLLSDLAANAELRNQMLADPEATFRKYGFQIDASRLPARPELANEAQLEKSARDNLDREEARQHSASDLFLFRS
jgi:hypothetical protein